MGGLPYRVKVVHGRKSIIWAKSVLPVFMAPSGKNPRSLHEPVAVVQIDTTLHRLESRISHGFQRFASSFDRIVVDMHMQQS